MHNTIYSIAQNRTLHQLAGQGGAPRTALGGRAIVRGALGAGEHFITL